MDVFAHPSREEGTVFELAQVESDEEGSGHENQGEQSGVGLASDRHLHSLRGVAQHHRDVFCCSSAVCAVVEGAAF